MNRRKKGGFAAGCCVALLLITLCAAAGGGRVLVPGGHIYKSGSLLLHSHVAAERRIPGGRSRCSGRETRWIRSLQK